MMEATLCDPELPVTQDVFKTRLPTSHEILSVAGQIQKCLHNFEHHLLLQNTRHKIEYSVRTMTSSPQRMQPTLQLEPPKVPNSIISRPVTA